MISWLIWLFPSNFFHCFSLCGEPLELLKQLPGGDIGQHEASSNDPPQFRRLIPDGLIEANVCKCYGDVFVNHSNDGDLAGENLFIMQGIFQGRLRRLFVHDALVHHPAIFIRQLSLLQIWPDHSFPLSSR